MIELNTHSRQVLLPLSVVMLISIVHIPHVILKILLKLTSVGKFNVLVIDCSVFIPHLVLKPAVFVLRLRLLSCISYSHCITATFYLADILAKFFGYRAL